MPPKDYRGVKDEYVEEWIKNLSETQPRDVSQYEQTYGIVALAKGLANALRTIRDLTKRIELLEKDGKIVKKADILTEE